MSQDAASPSLSRRALSVGSAVADRLQRYWLDQRRPVGECSQSLDVPEADHRGVLGRLRGKISGSTSMSPSVTEGPAAADLEWRLTDEQRLVLIKTWKDGFDELYSLGADIYVEVFERSPDARSLFPALAAQGSEWRHSKQFRQQALKFVQVLSSAIKNIYHPEHMTPMLHAVGKAHTKYAERGFRPHHWTVFQIAIEKSVINLISQQTQLNDRERQLAVEGWKTLAIYIVAHMHKGFSDAVVQTQVNKQEENT